MCVCAILFRYFSLFSFVDVLNVRKIHSYMQSAQVSLIIGHLETKIAWRTGRFFWEYFYNRSNMQFTKFYRIGSVILHLLFHPFLWFSQSVTHSAIKFQYMFFFCQVVRFFVFVFLNLNYQYFWLNIAHGKLKTMTNIKFTLKLQKQQFIRVKFTGKTCVISGKEADKNLAKSNKFTPSFFSVEFFCLK